MAMTRAALVLVLVACLVYGTAAAAFKKDVGIAPALIRILFHSILLNGTASELLELPNTTLRICRRRARRVRARRLLR